MHYNTPQHAAASNDPPPINHEALTYAHAAAVVRACAFPLSPKMSPALLQQVGWGGVGGWVCKQVGGCVFVLCSACDPLSAGEQPACVLVGL